MTKFVPTISARKYNLKLVAIVNDRTNIYTYIDDDGDQMLVRSFGDTTRLPFVEGYLALNTNPKTGRQYTTVSVTGIGKKEDFKPVTIPDSWREGNVVEGDALNKLLAECISDGIFALEYIKDAVDDLEDRMQLKTRDDSFRLSKKSRERVIEQAEADADKACEPLLTTDLGQLRSILESIIG